MRGTDIGVLHAEPLSMRLHGNAQSPTARCFVNSRAGLANPECDTAPLSYAPGPQRRTRCLQNRQSNKGRGARLQGSGRRLRAPPGIEDVSRSSTGLSTCFVDNGSDALRELSSLGRMRNHPHRRRCGRGLSPCDVPPKKQGPPKRPRARRQNHQGSKHNTSKHKPRKLAAIAGAPESLSFATSPTVMALLTVRPVGRSTYARDHEIHQHRDLLRSWHGRRSHPGFSVGWSAALQGLPPHEGCRSAATRAYAIGWRAGCLASRISGCRTSIFMLQAAVCCL